MHFLSHQNQNIYLIFSTFQHHIHATMNCKKQDCIPCHANLKCTLNLSQMGKMSFPGNYSYFLLHAAAWIIAASQICPKGRTQDVDAHAKLRPLCARSQFKLHFPSYTSKQLIFLKGRLQTFWAFLPLPQKTLFRQKQIIATLSFKLRLCRFDLWSNVQMKIGPWFLTWRLLGHNLRAQLTINQHVLLLTNASF